MSILMPKATAVWLIDHTALSFQQIGDFVDLHELEVLALANGDTVAQVQGESPLLSGLLSDEEIVRCSADPTAQLGITPGYNVPSSTPKGGRRYVPMLKRANKPNAVAWLAKEYPEMTDNQISKLVGSTKPTIQAIRTRNHWNMVNIAPGSPVELGLCSLQELQTEVDVALARRQVEDNKTEVSETD